jgi:hypothetical protein
VCFIPAIGLLSLYAQYIYQFDTAMVLLTALGFVCLYMGTTSKRRPMNLPVFLVLSIILYAIAGGIYLLFAVVCGIYELFFRRRPALALSFLLAALIVVYIGGAVVFNVSTNDIFDCFMPQSYRYSISILVLVYALYLLTPLTLICLWFVELLLKQREKVVPQEPEIAGKNLFVRFTEWSKGNAATMFAPLVAIIAGALVAFFSHNPALKTLIAVDYYASNKMWSKVLENSTRYQSNQLINHSANRALYHTGRLADDMFVYEQHPDALMLFAEPENPLAWWRVFDTCIDLGCMNMAEYKLGVCMEAYGERPVILKRLALVNMVKGKTGAARVFLGALSRTLFESDWARSYLEKIERDPNLSTDEEIQRLRSMIPAIDRDFTSLNENVFLDLLDKNRHNRMAFEYLAAFYLLTNQVDKFAVIIDRLDDFDYDRIPKAYEEAILFYSFTRKTKVDLHGRGISRQSRERFENFAKVFIDRYGTDKNAAFEELARDYGDSYLFYSVYGHSGIKK